MTRNARKAALYNAVFLTTELLENILEQLPMRDLLLAQRVCRKWKAVIEGSEYMQQLLYLKPAEAKFCWRVEDTAPWDLPTLTKVEADYKLRPGESMKATLFRHMDVNPLVMVNDPFQVMFDGPAMLENKLGTLAFVPQMRHKTWRNPKASWRRMLLSQPPVEMFVEGEGPCYMYCRGGCSEFGCHRLAELFREGGLRTSDMVDHIAACGEVDEGRIMWCKNDPGVHEVDHWLLFDTGDMLCPSLDH